MDDRIDKSIPRTDKVTLTCVNHPNLRWYTKNIGFIGDRTIFSANTDAWGRGGDHCDCHYSLLMLLSAHDKITRLVRDHLPL